MSFSQKPGNFRQALIKSMQGILAVVVPMTALSGEQHPVPEDFADYTNPAGQEVIIDLEAPLPRPEPVPPPVKTPGPAEPKPGE